LSLARARGKRHLREREPSPSGKRSVPVRTWSRAAGAVVLEDPRHARRWSGTPRRRRRPVRSIKCGEIGPLICLNGLVGYSIRIRRVVNDGTNTSSLFKIAWSRWHARSRFSVSVSVFLCRLEKNQAGGGSAFSYHRCSMFLGKGHKRGAEMRKTTSAKSRYETHPEGD